MIVQLKRQQTRIMAMISLTFLLTPAFSLWAAMFFGMLTSSEVRQILEFGLLPAFLAGMLAFVATYFWRFLQPLAIKLQTNPEHPDLAVLLHRRIRRYNLVYWGLFIFNAVCVSFILHYSMHKTGLNYKDGFIWNFLTLQMTISILVGMPAYLLSQDKLSQLSQFTGLLKVQNSMHSKLLLLGGLLPVLSYSLLLQYHWLGNGQLEPQILIIWAVLCVITVTLTLLTIRSLRQSLAPVQQALQSSGAVTHSSLAGLKAHSNDEIGYLTQALGKVFERLVDQETHIRAIIDNAAEGIIVTDEQGMVDTFNIAAQNLFNYDSHEVRGKPLSWLLHDMLENDGSPKHLSGRYKIKGIKRDGSNVSLSVCVSGVILRGKPVFIYLVNDISETEAALEKMQKAEDLYRDLVETAHDLVWSMDTQGHWTYLNKASVKLYGYMPDEMIGMPVSDFQHPDFAEQEQAAFSDISMDHELYQFETTHRDKYGKDICLSFNARAQTDLAGNIVRITGTARDITATKKYQRQLSYQAEHDALTGLYNRRFFQQELDRLIARVSRSSETCGLLYIDLDQFKYINDTLGHAAGDQLLVEISNMVSAHAREGDLFARFGGDEFTLLLYDIENDNLEKVAENFRRLFDDFIFYHEGKGFSVSCSIGVALIDENTRSSEQAMSHADLACNLAKTRGRNCVNIYKAEDRDEEGMADDMGWAARVKDMIDNDRFILAYQPIMDAYTRQIIDYELLMRMPTDDGKIILPGGFMPAAERFGLIHSLDNWMVKNVIARLADMHEQGIKAHFSINLSDRAIEDDNLVALIQEQLNQNGLEPGYLNFEISETAIITDLLAASAFMSKLKALGCLCTLDDFGSGYCSFGYLKDLPVDRIKIDGSVINNIATNPVDRALVQSMIQIAHVMDKVTVAECVENEQTLNILKELGVDYVQGHHLGRPVQGADKVHALACAQQGIMQ
jgi:diguanylate cyclase (GGDEF)-like protein/PAS domain S-box-containing protein